MCQGQNFNILVLFWKTWIQLITCWINLFDFSNQHGALIYKKYSSCTYRPLWILNLLFTTLCSLHSPIVLLQTLNCGKGEIKLIFIALYVPLCKCKFTTGLKIEPLNCLLRLFSTVHYGLRNTMRKNLPKTLDQLIFGKYTLVCSQIY